jgi:DNA-binding transcriptional regulator GbsR (MarR family)
VVRAFPHQGRQHRRAAARPAAIPDFLEIRAMKSAVETESAPARLSPFQRECIHLFVRAAQALSIPRSVGEIYGLLYSSREPMAMDDVIAALGISKGSASQGLRWLREVGAVRASYVVGDRRDHFVAETELRKLVFGILRESVEPHLQNGVEHLDRLAGSLEELESAAERKFADSRIQKLRRWHRFGAQILPLFLRIAGKF